MAYLRPWNASLPSGTEQSNTLATLIRYKCFDIEERLKTLFGITDFTADPLQGLTLNLKGAAACKLLPGATSFSVRNNADSADNLLVEDAGDVTIRRYLKGADVNGALRQRSGSTALFESPIQVSGTQARITPANVIAAAANQAIDWATSNTQQITLANNSTLSFSNPVAGAWYFLSIKQLSAGGYTITWPGTVVWPGGIGPTLTVTSGRTDFVSFFYTGTSYAGFVAGLNYNV
jgi:hypothetical protein